MNKHPQHVALCMDGSGRWAEMRNRPRIDGYRHGVERCYDLMRYASKIGLETLTLFVLSTENVLRPKEIVEPLLELFLEYIDVKLDDFIENNIQVRFVGDLSFFDTALADGMSDAKSVTKSNNGLLVNLAVNYSGRWDIANAIQHLNQTGEMPHTVSEIEQSLNTAFLIKDVDLHIRTSGEQRISNFTLWQSAYAELYFTDTLWPDFQCKEFATILDWYVTRKRRFGLLGS